MIEGDGRRQPLCKQNNKICVLILNVIEGDFRSSKMGWGQHHNGQPVSHSGIYTVFALGQIHQF